MAPDFKHPATGDLIVLAGDEQLWRIGWPGAPVLVVTKSGPDGNTIYWLQAEGRYGREATVARLEQLALVETQALSGELGDPQRLRMHSVGVDLVHG